MTEDRAREVLRNTPHDPAHDCGRENVAFACCTCDRHIRAMLALAAEAAQPAAGEGDLLDELATYLPSIRVFLTSNERPHEAGLQWHDELIGKVNAAREVRHV